MIRPILVLSALVVVLGTWAAWLDARAEHARSARDRSGTLFTSEQADSLRKEPALRIELAGESHVYGRVGGNWRCWSFRRAPADGAAIARLIDGLARAEGVVHASTVEEAPPYGINAPETIRVSIAGPKALEDPSGDVRASLEVGKSIPDAGAFVRKRGTKEIFAIDFDPRAELEPRVAPGLPPLLEPGVVPKSWSGWQSGLVEITIERADGERTVLARRDLELDPQVLAEGRMPWKWILDPGPAERDAATERAQSFVRFLERVPYVDVLDAERKADFGFASPAARVELRARAGEGFSLDLAPPSADGRIPLWIAANETLYLLDPRVATLLAPAATALAEGSTDDPWKGQLGDEETTPGLPGFPR